MSHTPKAIVSWLWEPFPWKPFWLISVHSQVVSEALPTWCRTENCSLAHRFALQVLIAYFGSWHNPKDFSAEGWVSPALGTRLLSLTLLSVRHTHFLPSPRHLTVSKAILRLGQARARWLDKLLSLLPLWFL